MFQELLPPTVELIIANLVVHVLGFTSNMNFFFRYDDYVAIYLIYSTYTDRWHIFTEIYQLLQIYANFNLFWALCTLDETARKKLLSGHSTPRYLQELSRYCWVYYISLPTWYLGLHRNDIMKIPPPPALFPPHTLMQLILLSVVRRTSPTSHWYFSVIS